MTAQAKLGIVVPVYNESNTIAGLLARLTPVLDRIGLPWQILFVDDGSIDDTADRLAALAKADSRIAVVTFSRNFGKEIAIAAGLQRVQGEAVVLIDADLQHPPELVEQFVALWREGWHMVYGQRRDREADGPVRRVFSRLFYTLFQSLSGTRLPDGAGDFRLLDRCVVDALNALPERARFSKGLYSWVGFRSIGVDFTIPKRLAGESRWRWRSLLHFAIDGVVSFSTLPLKVWSYAGLLISLCAFIYALIFVLKTLVFGIDVPGFPTIVVSVMFFSGVQLMSLGILGEYVARIYDESKKRPLFVVMNEINTDREPTS